MANDATHSHDCLWVGDISRILAEGVPVANIVVVERDKPIGRYGVVLEEDVANSWQRRWTSRKEDNIARVCEEHRCNLLQQRLKLLRDDVGNKLLVVLPAERCDVDAHTLFEVLNNTWVRLILLEHILVAHNATAAIV